MAREPVGIQTIAGSSFIFGSSSFWVSPRRSYPYGPTKLEILAARAGLDDEELRLLLEREVQRRRREVGESWDKLDVTLEKRENGRSQP